MTTSTGISDLFHLIRLQFDGTMRMRSHGVSPIIPVFQYEEIHWRSITERVPELPLQAITHVLPMILSLSFQLLPQIVMELILEGPEPVFPQYKEVELYPHPGSQVSPFRESSFIGLQKRESWFPVLPV